MKKTIITIIGIMLTLSAFTLVIFAGVNRVEPGRTLIKPHLG